MTAQDWPLEPGLNCQISDDLQSVELVLKPFVNVKIQRKTMFVGRREGMTYSSPPVCLIKDKDSEGAANGGNLPGDRIRNRRIRDLFGVGQGSQLQGHAVTAFLGHLSENRPGK